MTNSRQKGAAYEREVANLFKSHGLTARRGQQYSGANGDPDVMVLEYDDLIHIECKRVEKLNLYKAIEQADNDAPEKTPVVVHRKNGKPSLVTMYFQDWIDLMEAYTILYQETCLGCKYRNEDEDRCTKRNRLAEPGNPACKYFERIGDCGL